MFTSTQIIRRKGAMHLAASGLIRQTCVLGFALLLTLVSAQPIFAQAITPNPDFQGNCDTRIALVLDASDSIQNPNNAVGTMRNEALSLLNSLLGTGTQVAIVEFAVTADIPIGYTTVDQNAIDTVFTALSKC